jgi:hypothetical protein
MPGVFPVEIGAAGIVGSPGLFGAIGGAEGTEGMGAIPVFPEVLGASLLGTSFSFGISLGGVVVGVVVGVIGAIVVPQHGLATGPQHDGFLKDHDLILSRRFGR